MTADEQNAMRLTPIAHRILVPIANPATAEGLLRLALSLVAEDGRVFATYVTVTGAEPRPDSQEKLEALVEFLREEGAHVETVTNVASSIARGILDSAQEHGADLIVLGIRGLQRGKVVLGPVVDAVARTALCNVLIYRGMQPLYGGQGYKDVVVPVDGSSNSRLAARIGLRFANHTNAPVNALFVQTESSMRRWQALGMIEASLEGIEHAERFRKLVVHSKDIVSGILSRSEQNTLVVLGFSEESSLDSWLFGQIPQRMLMGVPGPLLLVKIGAGDTVSEKIERSLFGLMPTLTPSEEAEVTRTAQEMAKPNTNYFVLVILSCLIASLGLLQNSAAVIIGAMLIAPLMSPLMGFGVGLTQGDFRLMRTSIFTVGRGMLLALLLAILTGFLTPFDMGTPEMLARGQPSLPDMGVALFSGMAGAYALARKDIPSALAGTAIAAALMPPLCTAGIAVAFGDLALASGAFLLFVTNIVSISLAAAAVFLWLGVRLRLEEYEDHPARYRMRMAISVVALVVLAIPLGQALLNTSQQEARLETVRTTLEETFVDVEIVDVLLRESAPLTNEPLQVVATLRLGQVPTPDDVRAVERSLAGEIGEEINLELVVWQVVKPVHP